MDSVNTVHDSMDTVVNVHGLSRQCPSTQWTISIDSVNIFHGLNGHCPVQPPLTLPTESLDIVHSLVPMLQLDNVHGKCALNPWTFYRQVRSTAYDIGSMYTWVTKTDKDFSPQSGET